MQSRPRSITFRCVVAAVARLAPATSHRYSLPDAAQALEIFPFDANALLLYSNFLHSQGEVAVSQRFSEYEAHFRTHPLGRDEETDGDDASDDDEGDTDGTTRGTHCQHSGDGGDVKR